MRRELFKADEGLADRYRESIETAPIGEQILAFHETPLALAGILAGDLDGIDRHADAYHKHFSDELDAARSP